MAFWHVTCTNFRNFEIWEKSQTKKIVVLQLHKSDCQPEQSEKPNNFFMISQNYTERKKKGKDTCVCTNGERRQQLMRNRRGVGGRDDCWSTPEK